MTLPPRYVLRASTSIPLEIYVADEWENLEKIPNEKTNPYLKPFANFAFNLPTHFIYFSLLPLLPILSVSTRIISSRCRFVLLMLYYCLVARSKSSAARMILRFSYARFQRIYIKQLTELFGEISENSSRLQTNARNFKCNFAGGTVYKLNFVSGALESSTRQRLPIIQNLMQTVSTLSKSIYPRPKSGSGLQSDTAPPLAISVSTRPFHHFTALFSLLSPISFLHPLIPSVSRVLYPLLSPPRGNRNLRIHGKSGWGCILYIYAYGRSVAYSR